MTHHHEQHEHRADTAALPDQYEQHAHAPAEAHDNHAPEQPQDHSLETGVQGLVDQVEQQLRRLREAQQAQDEELTRLNERFSRLEQAESDLADRRAAVQQQQALLQAEQDALLDRERAITTRAAEISNREQELEQRRDEIDQREQQLREDVAKNGDRDELLRRVDQAERNVGELIEQVEKLQKSLDEREELLQSNREQRAAVEALQREQQAQIDRLQRDIAERDERLNSRQQQLSELEDKLAQAERQNSARVAEYEAQLEQLRSEHASSSTADQAVLQSLRDRVEELEQQLEDAAKTVESSEAAQQQVHEQARRITELEQHIRRRQGRLKKMRSLLRQRHELLERKADQREAYEQELRAIDKQTQRLNDMRASLVAAEREMARRWARPRAVVTIGWACLLIIANLAASWLLASQLFPAERTALVTLAPQTRSGEPLSSDRIDSWQQWHVATLQNGGFHRTLASRYAERGMEAVSTEHAVKSLIDERLGVDLNRNGSFTLTLAGHDRRSLAPKLDVLATTLAAESRQRAGSRGDSAWATIRGERLVRGQLQYASLNPWTNNDRRFIWMWPFFVLTAGASCTLVWLIYQRLVLAKRVFDEQCRVA